jgi:hypothetical protein
MIFITDLALAGLTAIIALLFFLAVLEQYLRKRKTHQWIWAAALFMFVITTSIQLISGLLNDWNVLAYKIYYVLAAFQVFFLGIGVLYLLTTRNIITSKNGLLVLLSTNLIWILLTIIYMSRDQIFALLFAVATSTLVIIFGIVGLLKKTIPSRNYIHIIFAQAWIIFFFMVYIAIQSPVYTQNLLIGSEVSGLGWQENPTELRAIVRLFSPFFTIPGAIMLIGGTSYSYLLWQWALKKQHGSFKLTEGFFNIFLALGAIVFSSGGALSGSGYGFLYLSEIVGMALMFIGFIESDREVLNKLLRLISLGIVGKKKS